MDVAKARFTITEQDLQSMAVFPLPSSVLIPRSICPLHIFEPRYQRMTEDALSTGMVIAIALAKPGLDSLGRQLYHRVVGAGRIMRHERLPGGRFNILVVGLARVRIVSELPTATPYRQACAVSMEDRVDDAPEAERLMKMLQASVLAMRVTEPAAAEDLALMLDTSEGYGAVADRMSAVLFPSADERQRVLEEPVVERRLNWVVDRFVEVLAHLQGETAPAAN